MNDLHDWLGYEPESGLIFWKKDRNSRAKSGDTAGTLRKSGYLQIGFKGKVYLAHRVAWFLFYKEWPKGQIDHKDQNPLNNRINNLRDVDNRTNSINRTTFKGGVIQIRGRWYARARIGGIQRILGSFSTEKEAVLCYRKFVDDEAELEDDQEE